MATKNRWGKTVPKAKAYAILKLADWTWYVLKAYQGPDKEIENPYSLAFCLVVSPMTGESGDMGDTYCREIPGYFRARARWEAENPTE